MYELYENHYIGLQNNKKYRELQVKLTENSYLDFSTNDYLNLSQSEKLIESALNSARKFGVGATGSRLLSGNQQIFSDLEKKIARDKNTETALIFNSGFQANISALASLLDEKILKTKPLVFFDKLNHASLYQAAFLAQAEIIRYQHNNIEHLASLLEKYENIDRPKFIVTETIFGMDSDITPIEKIIALAKKYKLFIYLDEAHATGVFGKNGYGIATDFDFTGVNHVIMGSFSKAIGCSGAYIACSNIIKKFLINHTKGFIYSTALSPMLVGAIKKSWELIKESDYTRKNLLENASYLRCKLTEMGLNIGKTETHIIPIILESEEKALKAKQILQENKIIVSAIRPPTVPPDSSRIRIALTA